MKAERPFAQEYPVLNSLLTRQSFYPDEIAERVRAEILEHGEHRIHYETAFALFQAKLAAFSAEQLSGDASSSLTAVREAEEHLERASGSTTLSEMVEMLETLFERCRSQWEERSLDIANADGSTEETNRAVSETVDNYRTIATYFRELCFEQPDQFVTPDERN